MLFFLSLRLGFPHPDYLLPHLTARQLLDWQRFHAQYNLGIDRDDLYHAQIMSALYNANKTKEARTLYPNDFLIWNRVDPLDEEISQEQLITRIKGSLP